MNPLLLSTLTTMALKIYLARHGQDEDNAAGILNGHRNQPLTKLGEEQAQSVAAKIQSQQELQFDKIYASPLKRAFKTAEILANGQQQQSVEVMDLLIERDFGVMAGVPTKEIKERCKGNILQTETISYFLSPEGAETFPELLERGNKVIADIQTKHKEGSVLLVTHGDFGKMLYAAYYKLDWMDVLKQFHFGNSEVLLLSEESSPTDAHVFQIQQYNP
mmetsp:Transcript_9459/g.22310  ORF Transcript_9459/g.22310 Transcript_9459/m.22310 type:complete len:219 (-) Transcript_9459:29-685(-)